MTEQAILQLARIQAQRDEETGRLRAQIKQLTDSLREREEASGGAEDELRAKIREIEELKLTAEREAALVSGGREAQDRLTYLKNVVFRYIKAGDGAPERASLVPVICTILRFSPEEEAEVKRTASVAVGGSSFLTSLIWGAAPASASAVPVVNPSPRRPSNAPNPEATGS